MATWRVDSVTPTTEFVSGGNVQEGARVAFTTDTGVSGHVFVPQGQIGDTDAVREMINEKAEQLDSLRRLSG